MQMCVIDCTNNSIVEFVEDVKNLSLEKYAEFAENNFKFVCIPFDLEQFTDEQLTGLYNTLTNQAHAELTGTKTKRAKKVFDELIAHNTASVVEQDKKKRKVRNSKLQRMKAAFLSKNEDGSYKAWSVKALMETCDTTERITHVYISTLRSPTGRFVMDITKSKDDNLFTYVPKVNVKVKRETEEEAVKRNTETDDIIAAAAHRAGKESLVKTMELINTVSDNQEKSL
jgi:hypothetical protein